MLVNVELSNKLYEDPLMKALGKIISNGRGTNKIIDGIYETDTFNFEYELKSCGFEVINQYMIGSISDYEEIREYGVCDNYQQILDKFPAILDRPNKYVISLTRIVKSEQESPGGWRWHKWGEYIGSLNPQCEYIANEDDSIQEVFCFHLHEVANV